MVIIINVVVIVIIVIMVIVIIVIIIAAIIVVVIIKDYTMSSTDVYSDKLVPKDFIVEKRESSFDDTQVPIICVNIEGAI